MITDSQTNFLYLADCLPKKQPDFFHRFEKILIAHKINFKFLPHTKDIWAVDYMPVQISKEHFVQFTYNPDYLRNSKKWHKTISDVDSICSAINLKPKKTELLVDGGNVIRAMDKVIICDKVFAENPEIPEKKLIKQLQELLQTEKIIFVPTQPNDDIGHADCMVRFLDENTVLINDYSKEKPEFQRSFRMSLHNAGLDYIEIPYNPYKNDDDYQANGIYINYFEMENIIIVPTFEMKEDEAAVKVFEEVLKGKTIITLDSNEIAKEGGVLNCISWNIMK